MTARTNYITVILIALAACFAMPQAALAQDGGDTIKLPRNMVKGGSLGARRPGLWSSAGLGNASARNKEIVNNFGGVEYTQTEADLEPPRRQVILIAAIEQFFNTLMDVIVQLGLNAAVNPPPEVPIPI